MNTLYYGDDLKILRDYIKDSFGMVPVGMRKRNADTPVRNEHEVRTYDYPTPDAESSTTSSASDARIADKSVRVPSYRIVGQPEDLDGAKELAEKDKFGFQW